MPVLAKIADIYRPSWLLRSLLLLAFVSLVACGGGGGATGASNSGGGSGGTSGSPELVGPVTLVGVASFGAPLLGGTLTVIDGNGVIRGQSETSTADGSFSVAIAATGIPLPLLVEANGIDMTGKPLSLHTVIQTVPTGATRMVANLSPATEAIVAMLLGADPADEFANASSVASGWTLLGNATALTTAVDFLKTVIKTNITDAKVTNASTLDFFSDASFASNKSGQDAIFSGIHVQVGRSSNDRVQLELSNRFKVPGLPEVTVDLATARTQLSLGATGKLTNAITSTAKATTGVASLINNVGSLDTLSSAINQASAEQLSAILIVLKPFFSTTYAVHDGLNAFDLASVFSDYGLAGKQISRLQFVGCGDVPLPPTGCNRPMVAALVSDASGQVVGYFNNVVSYNATTGWTLKGNGRSSNWSITGASWASFSDAGVLGSSGQGVRLHVDPLVDSLRVTLSLPSVHSISLYDCLNGFWCLNQTTQGDVVSDTVLQSSQLGWFGLQDSVRGARYQLSALSILVPDGETSSVVLPNDVPRNVAANSYPVPDGISTVNNLTCSDIASGLRVTWSNWAAVNPTMRMVSVNSVMNEVGQISPWIQAATVQPLGDAVVDVPAAITPPVSPSSCQLWMVARDRQGREFISRINAAP